MHSYGDEDFDAWDDLDDAASYIGNLCRKWGRIQVWQYKEKFGTVRVYCSINCQSLHDLIFPGYCLVHKPYGFWVFPIFRPFHMLVFKYQKFIYRLAYKNAVRKWPCIRKEILCCADFPEYLKNA